MSLTSDLLRGYTDTIILRRLTLGNSYGYEINKQVKELSGGAFELKEATLYTAFRRLQTAGLISSYWGDEGSGARRRYYSITAAGLQRLQNDCEAWLNTQELLTKLLNPTDL